MEYNVLTLHNFEVPIDNITITHNISGYCRVTWQVAW